MARSRRKTSFKPRRRFKRTGDWVYRANTYDAAGALIDALGTYTREETQVAAGEANAIAGVLYDSHNRIKQ